MEDPCEKTGDAEDRVGRCLRGVVEVVSVGCEGRIAADLRAETETLDSGAFVAWVEGRAVESGVMAFDNESERCRLICVV